MPTKKKPETKPKPVCAFCLRAIDDVGGSQLHDAGVVTTLDGRATAVCHMGPTPNCWSLYMLAKTNAIQETSVKRVKNEDPAVIEKQFEWERTRFIEKYARRLGIDLEPVAKEPKPTKPVDRSRTYREAKLAVERDEADEHQRTRRMPKSGLRSTKPADEQI